MSKCIPCLQGMPNLCMTGGNCDVVSNNPSDTDKETDILSPETGVEVFGDDDASEENYKRGPARKRKKTSTLKDPESTGRKEAFRLYPLHRDEQCEWAYLKAAGGGEFPIKGCGITRPVGKQENRHHGPDKNTMNNTEGNVHRICSSCHNQWHAKNDETRLARKGKVSD